MFEHLDDNTPHRTGTTPQLAAVRNRARQISTERRRNKLALGSVTLAATAVVSGAAVAGSLTGSGTATGQAGTSGGAKPAEPKAASPTAKPTAEGNLKTGADPSADALKRSRLASDGLKTPDASEGPVTPKPVCSPTLPSLAGVAAPGGYSIVDTPNQGGAQYVGSGGATVKIKVTCSPVESPADMAKDGMTVSDAQVPGHTAFQWTGQQSDIGIGWATKAGAIYIQAAGPAASRLTLAELEAFAATVPSA